MRRLALERRRSGGRGRSQKGRLDRVPWRAGAHVLRRTLRSCETDLPSSGPSRDGFSQRSSTAGRSRPSGSRRAEAGRAVPAAFSPPGERSPAHRYSSGPKRAPSPDDATTPYPAATSGQPLLNVPPSQRGVAARRRELRMSTTMEHQEQRRHRDAVRDLDAVKAQPERACSSSGCQPLDRRRAQPLDDQGSTPRAADTSRARRSSMPAGAILIGTDTGEPRSCSSTRSPRAAPIVNVASARGPATKVESRSRRHGRAWALGLSAGAQASSRSVCSKCRGDAPPGFRGGSSSGQAQSGVFGMV